MNALRIDEVQNLFPVASAFNPDFSRKRTGLIRSDEALANRVAGDPLQGDLVVMESVGYFSLSDSTPMVNLISIIHKGWPDRIEREAFSGYCPIKESRNVESMRPLVCSPVHPVEKLIYLTGGNRTYRPMPKFFGEAL